MGGKNVSIDIRQDLAVCASDVHLLTCSSHIMIMVAILKFKFQ